MQKHERVTVTVPTLDELIRVCNELAETVATVRYSMWTRTDDGLALKGVTLNAEILDGQLIDAEAAVRHVKRQISESRRRK